jgi:hypothetical protein
MNQFPQTPEFPIRAIWNSYENSRRFSELVFIASVNDTPHLKLKTQHTFRPEHAGLDDVITQQSET